MSFILHLSSLILPLLVLCASVPLCENALAQRFDPNKKVDGHVGYNAERMAELPAGSNQLELWVVVSPQWRSRPIEARVAQWFTNDQRLNQIKGGCRFNYYESSNPLFAESELIKKVGTATPIVWLTKPDGETLVGLNANTLSKLRTPGELADMLVAGIEQANPAPVFAGQSDSTPLVRDCPDGQCTPSGPNVSPGPVQPELSEVVPHTPLSPHVALAIALSLVVLSVIGVLLLALGLMPRGAVPSNQLFR